MFKCIRRIAFLAIPIFSIVFIAYWQIAVHLSQTAYDQIQIGTSQKEVLKMMGNPNFVSKPCKIKKCNVTEIWGFNSPSKYWSISFDKDGRVSEKFQISDSFDGLKIYPDPTRLFYRF